MSTNFYVSLRKPQIFKDAQPLEIIRLHLGKRIHSSRGFHYQAYENWTSESAYSLWCGLVHLGVIVDEYGVEYKSFELFTTASACDEQVQQSNSLAHEPLAEDQFIDSAGRLWSRCEFC